MATNGPAPLVLSADKCDADARFRNGNDETGVGSVQDTTVDDWNATEKKKEEKKKPKASAKSTAPPVVTKEGTYCRLLNVYFDEKHRPDVTQLGANATIAAIDARKFKHKAITFTTSCWVRTNQPTMLSSILDILDNRLQRTTFF